MNARIFPGMAVLAAACVCGSSASATDWDRIKAGGALRVVITWPGSEFFARDGDPRGPGLERELLEGFAKLHRIQLKAIEVPGYNELLPALLGGRGDLIACNITVTEKRSRAIVFTAEVLPTRQVVVTKRPHRVVNTIDELRQERLVTISGTSMAEAIAGAGVPPANVDDAVPPGSHLCQLLGLRGVTATVEEVSVAILRKRDDPNLQLGMFVGPPGSVAWGVRKTDPTFTAMLNEYIGYVRKQGIWNRLVVKYFGADALDILRKARGDS